MKSALRHGSGLLTAISLLACGCAEQGDENTFTVRQIDSTRNGDGSVRIKLTTPGNRAEADESLLTSYVKVVAVRAASERQRQVAMQRARAAWHKMTSAGTPSKRPARYLAVMTEKGRGSGQAKPLRSIMLWDTFSQAIVGNNVYEVEGTPATGGMMRLETYSAQYVGGGP